MRTHRTRRFALLVGASFLSLSTGGAAFAQFQFGAPTSFSTGVEPGGLAAGDFDADGDLDLAVITNGATGAQDRAEIYLNDGTGSYSPGQILALPNSSSASEVVAADLDGDGDIDLAVVLRDFNQVMRLVNNGGVFAQGATAPVGNDARALAAADLEGDGDVDLAVANRNDGSATILVNNGAGGFTAVTLAAGADARGVALGDFTGDGLLDVAITSNDDRDVTLYANTGAGFSPMGSLSTGGVLRPEAIVASDLNDDGLIDLAAATNGNALNMASVWLNTGGAFGARADYATGGQDTSGILAADLDCDGRTDLVTRNLDSSNLSVLQNLGGTFGAATLLAAGADPDQFIAADVDGEGGIDLLVANRAPSTVTIIDNLTCQPAFAALTGFTVTTGSVAGGGLAELTGSDDAALHTRSGFGRTFIDLHNMTLEVTGNTGGQTASTVTITVESRIDEPAGTQRVFLADWTNNGAPVQVGSNAVGLTDTRMTYAPQPAARFVSSGGDVRVTVRHFVFVPIFAFVFDSFIDEVQIRLD